MEMDLVGISVFRTDKCGENSNHGSDWGLWSGLWAAGRQSPMIPFWEIGRFSIFDFPNKQFGVSTTSLVMDNDALGGEWVFVPVGEMSWTLWISLHASNCIVFWRNVGEREARCQRVFLFCYWGSVWVGAGLWGEILSLTRLRQKSVIRRSTDTLCSDSVCCPQGLFSEILICFSLWMLGNNYTESGSECLSLDKKRKIRRNVSSSWGIRQVTVQGVSYRTVLCNSDTGCPPTETCHGGSRS